MRIIITAVIVTLLTSVSVPGEETPVLERIEWSDIWINNADKDDLPRVLLVGDSIVKGYYNEVEKQLAGKADCARYATSKFAGNPDYVTELSIILNRHTFDVIHFNNGLHGWGYTEEQYERALTDLLIMLKKLAPKAKLIWCMSTPVRDKNDLSKFGDRNGRVIERNRIAVGIMRRNGVIINDLYSLVSDHPEYQSQDGVHFNDTGKAAQAEQVANMIEKQLSD
ncbi:MAG: SGNH/GDSL hydrolase family protein [Candidatus Latescibacteria bacterium]|nr:SGNH/GDSL hydrolase family protein [Candidatus Latescibacterota bacterium]